MHLTGLKNRKKYITKRRDPTFPFEVLDKRFTNISNSFFHTVNNTKKTHGYEYKWNVKNVNTKSEKVMKWKHE